MSYKCIRFLNTHINSENTVISIYIPQKKTQKKNTKPSLTHSLSLPFFLTPFSPSLSLAPPPSLSLSSLPIAPFVYLFHVTFSMFSYLSSSYFFFYNPCLSQLLLLRSLSTTRMLLSIVSVSLLQFFSVTLLSSPFL